MDANDWLARRFDQDRARLRAVAYRMLGSASEADDAVQETWLKLSRSGSQTVENLGGWLTTVLARVCLDMLRARRSRREEPLAAVGEAPGDGSLEDDLALADATGPALLIILERLAPGERVAFVLHDMFNLSFEEIARILNRTPAAVRQLASRARRRVQGTEAPAADISVHRELVSAFLAASREGDFQRLVAVLSPDVVLRADETAVRTAAKRQAQGAPALDAEARGASRVASTFQGRARGASAALIDGKPGAAWAVGGRILAVFLFTIEGEKITGINIVTEPAHLAELDVELD
ncbi:MAG TPA: sigma-70 family RNA polymerase sigma factor [Steroidobacteraceae bacterium]|nr:sigma-70 family RNA polymerase sigma factor [Steroidobacteraceae bacterium]